MYLVQENKKRAKFKAFTLKENRNKHFFPSESRFLDFSLWTQGYRIIQTARCSKREYYIQQ